MWGYLSLLPAFLALWATAGVWTVFALAVTNRSVNLTEGFPYISLCGSYPPQSCIFSQLLNMGAAMAAWICIIRYHQLRDWGVGKWFNQLILWTGLLCALGTSVVGNFQQKNQLPTHLIGAFFALFVGNLYFWLQLFLFWRMRSLPQPGAPWIRLLRLGLCSLCTILMVAKWSSSIPGRCARPPLRASGPSPPCCSRSSACLLWIFPAWTAAPCVSSRAPASAPRRPPPSPCRSPCERQSGRCGLVPVLLLGPPRKDTDAGRVTRNQNSFRRANPYRRL
ncbi:modulator of macroautophagy TMEM150B isoform X1 [Eumetopias jubatus]|uniref:modulator of macroautophagy TMEM150B isoform X1 n=1 Tax=Eumetopias jubatus TaxID=34886 RepID=UPI001016CEEC|nr:modulator of macroautophagy TMEM150B isoform X1 [Eumetopias jubatus]XP_027950835.1 modulator of macroautophagy TMEM150B isoform X1 [Eumetopias jubatus]XP_027950836.1 modulator of macroautophagy TMEM150B isoform X1 [Eumetopias jubatus]